MRTMKRNEISSSNHKRLSKKVNRHGSTRINRSNYILFVWSVIFVAFSFITISIIAIHFHLPDIESRDVAGIQSIRKVDTNPAKSGGQFNIDASRRGEGSKLGTIQCDENVSSLISYWNDPLSETDRNFQSPFWDNSSESNALDAKTKYLSFEPDPGGWNNIRMEFEIMFVLAAATGRTLILPPDHPFYLLTKDSKEKHRSFQDFFQYQSPEYENKQSGSGGFDEIIKTITTAEFFQREIFESENYILPSDETNRTKLSAAINKCDIRLKSPKSCIVLYDFLAQVAEHVPEWHGESNCLIMDDENWYHADGHESTMLKHSDEVNQFCAGRTPYFYNEEIYNARLLHIRSHSKMTRLLVHFYAFIYFTDPKVGNHFKRMVRDRVRYSDKIFCPGGKIVKALLGEANGADGGYSSIHIRRGDFQWANMRISAEEWYEHVKDKLRPGELVYIATDETNRTFFEPLKKHFKLRFLSDYHDLIGMDNLDPNYMVCTLSRQSARYYRVFMERLHVMIDVKLQFFSQLPTMSVKSPSDSDNSFTNSSRRE